MSCYRSPSGHDTIAEWARTRLVTWDVPHTTERVDTGAGATHLVRCGTETRTLLVLPGTNMSSAVLLDLLEQLIPQWSVVAADLPGQPGLSDPEAPAGSLAGLGRWADEVVAALAPPVTVLGHSLGAAIALSMGPTATIAGLTLVNPAGLVGARPTPRLLAVTVPWLKRSTTTRAARLVRYMSAPGSELDPAMVEWMRLVGLHCRSTGAPGPISDEGIATWQTTPCRIVAGRYDRFFPQRRLQARCQDFGLPLVPRPDAGHLLPTEQPHALAALADPTSPPRGTRR